MIEREEQVDVTTELDSHLRTDYENCVIYVFSSHFPATDPRAWNTLADAISNPYRRTDV